MLLGKTNPNRFVFLEAGVDQLIDASYEGGFGGWPASIAAYEPDAILRGRSQGPHIAQLEGWLAEDYDAHELGYWQIYCRLQTHRPGIRVHQVRRSRNKNTSNQQIEQNTDQTKDGLGGDVPGLL